ncbi:MAG: hypothetical protein ACP5E3_19585 [Bacteroidales bacterium]
MNKLGLALILLLAISFISCEDEEENTDRFNLLTTPTWTSDSLLVDGEDASGPGQILENFKGNAKFNEDGTGYFGLYTGTWRFSRDETEVIIVTDSLVFPLTTKIEELTTESLKITTGFPDLLGNDMDIRMTFNVK